MKYEMYRNSVQKKSHREMVLFLYTFEGGKKIK